MKIDVVSKVDEVKFENVKNKTVIVVDVLRASSTIITALAHGAKEVVPVETIGQAKQYDDEKYLLVGERYCKRIPGFPYTNSPVEMAGAPVHGFSLVLTTTNGTRAVQKSLKADHVLIGSFLNARACAMKAAQLRRDVTILCAGSRQLFSLEDGLAAGYLVSLICREAGECCINDLGLAMLAAYHYSEKRLGDILQESATGKRLMAAGCEEDISFCSNKDVYDIVPEVRGETIILNDSVE